LTVKVDELVLRDLFDSIEVDDPNIINVHFLDNLSSLETSTRNNKEKVFIEGNSDAAFPITMIAVSALVTVGVVGTVLVLILGRAGGHFDRKQVKDDNSSAIAKSDMTTVMSPTRNVEEITEEDIERWPNPFIVSEQEKMTWQNWGIISAPKKKRLEYIREEMWSDDEYFDERSI
jgi:hypothetical protein